MWIYALYMECQTPTGAVEPIYVLKSLGCGFVIKL